MAAPSDFEECIDLDETCFSRQHTKYSGLGNTPDDAYDYYGLDDDNESEPGIQGHHTTKTMRMPRHTLRSRPTINFSTCNSSVSTDLSLPASAAAHHTATNMSGSTRYSGLNATEIPPPRKTASLGTGPGVSYLNVPVQVIASLTVSNLYWNPHFRKLHQDYDYVSQTLSQYYAEMELIDSCAVRNETVIAGA